MNSYLKDIVVTNLKQTDELQAEELERVSRSISETKRTIEFGGERKIMSTTSAMAVPGLMLSRLNGSSMKYGTPGALSKSSQSLKLSLIAK